MKKSVTKSFNFTSKRKLEDPIRFINYDSNRIQMKNNGRTVKFVYNANYCTCDSAACISKKYDSGIHTLRMKLIAGSFGNCVSAIGIASNISKINVLGGIMLHDDVSFGNVFSYNVDNFGDWKINEIVEIILNFNDKSVIISKGGNVIVNKKFQDQAYYFVFAPCDCNSQGGTFEILDN